MKNKEEEESQLNIALYLICKIIKHGSSRSLYHSNASFQTFIVCDAIISFENSLITNSLPE